MLATSPSPAALGEHELRRRIDRSISRALVDRDYARQLLADPSLVLEDSGCTPQQQVELRSIRADSLTDFARQAEALFWLSPTAAHAAQRHQRAAAAAV